LPTSKKKRRALLQETLQLVEQLIDYGFVYYIDDIKIQRKKRKKINPPYGKQKILRPLFSSWAMLIYFGILFVAIAITLNKTKYFPQPQHIFWYPSLPVSLITYFIISLFLLFKHELAHLLSASAYGLRSKFYLSRRFFYLVAETQIKDIYKLPRRKRFIIYLAGLASDSALYGLCIFMQVINDKGFFIFSNLFYSFLKQVAVASWIAILWQLRFFMKTDIYALFEDYTGIDELLFLAQSKIKYTFYKILNYFSSRFKAKLYRYQLVVEGDLYQNAKQILSWYAWFVLIGTVITLIQFGFYDLRISYMVVKNAFLKIFLGLKYLSQKFVIEGSLGLLIQLLYWGLLLYVLIKEHIASKVKRWDEDIYYVLSPDAVKRLEKFEKKYKKSKSVNKKRE
jgi:hypothetical protein